MNRHMPELAAAAAVFCHRQVRCTLCFTSHALMDDADITNCSEYPVERGLSSTMAVPRDT